MIAARVIRGFRRLGIILAVPFVVAGAVAIGVYVTAAPSVLDIPAPPPGFEIAQRPPWERNWSGRKEEVKTDLSKMSNEELLRLRASYRRDREPLAWAGVLLALGAAVYFISLAFGWVLAGFARE